MASLTRTLKDCKKSLQAADEAFSGLEVLFSKEENNPYKDAFIKAYDEDTYNRVKNKTLQCNDLIDQLLGDWESALERDIEDINVETEKTQQRVQESMTSYIGIDTIPADVEHVMIQTRGSFIGPKDLPYARNYEENKCDGKVNKKKKVIYPEDKL